MDGAEPLPAGVHVPKLKEMFGDYMDFPVNSDYVNALVSGRDYKELASLHPYVISAVTAIGMRSTYTHALPHHEQPASFISTSSKEDASASGKHLEQAVSAYKKGLRPEALPPDNPRSKPPPTKILDSETALLAKVEKDYSLNAEQAAVYNLLGKTQSHGY